MEDFLAQYGGLLGLAALIALVIDGFKRLGWVQDGTSQNWSLALNFVGFLGFVLLRWFKPELDYLALDATLAAIATIGTSIIALIAQLAASKITHAVLKGTPLAKSL
jgi:hypothetical protein